MPRSHAYKTTTVVDRVYARLCLRLFAWATGERHVPRVTKDSRSARD